MNGLQWLSLANLAVFMVFETGAIIGVCTDFFAPMWVMVTVSSVLWLGILGTGFYLSDGEREK